MSERRNLPELGLSEYLVQKICLSRKEREKEDNKSIWSERAVSKGNFDGT